MKILPYTLILVAMVHAAPTFASLTHGIFEKNPDWTLDGLSYTWHMRDGNLAPSGLHLRIQYLSSVAHLLSPPWTNCFDIEYEDPNGGVGRRAGIWSEYQTIYESGCKRWIMGDDSIHQGYPAGDGCCSGDWNDDRENVALWIRPYSGSEVTNSAYYGDSDTVPYVELGYWYDYWPETNYFINKVNPAYRIPGFQVASAVSSHYVETALAISGLVTTVATSNNYLLHDSVVTVLWHCVAVTNYTTHAAITNQGQFPVFGGGTWTGTIDLIRYQPFDYFGTSNTLTLIAIGASIRSGLPCSEEITYNLVTVPEPVASAAVLMALAAGSVRRRLLSSG